MPDTDYFRELARRCRTLARVAIVPAVKEQLRVWSVELADRADQAERAPRRPRKNRHIAGDHRGFSELRQVRDTRRG